MKKKSYQLKIHPIIISVLFLFISFPAFSDDKILITDHFQIHYNNENSSCAMAMGVRLESFHDKITAFLDTEPNDRVKIFISNGSGIFFSSKTIFDSNYELHIPSDGNFKIIDIEVYNKLFLIYLQKIIPGGILSSGIDKCLIKSLTNYPYEEPELVEFLLCNMVNTAQIQQVDLTKKNDFSEEKNELIYTALIDFIISGYGKKIFFQALRDSDYYGGFYFSLAKITGDSIDSITENFNIYLLKKKSIIQQFDKEKKKPLHNKNEYSDIGFSISESGQVAVLQKKNNDYRLLFPNDNNAMPIELDHSESGSFFSSIVFNKNDHIAVVEMLSSGSKIYIYNTVSSVLSKNIFLPLIFINSINCLDTDTFLISAACGLYSDIYTLKINSSELNILTESGNCFYPVASGNNIYYILNSGKKSIMELNTNTGETKTLFSTDREIPYLNKINDNKLLFAMKTGGLENGFSLDIHNGNLNQIIDKNCPGIKPQVYGKFIYFFSLNYYEHELYISGFEQ